MRPSSFRRTDFIIVIVVIALGRRRRLVVVVAGLLVVREHVHKWLRVVISRSLNASAHTVVLRGLREEEVLSSGQLP